MAGGERLNFSHSAPDLTLLVFGPAVALAYRITGPPTAGVHLLLPVVHPLPRT